MSEITYKQMFETMSSGMATLVATISKAVKDRYGEEGLEVVREAIKARYVKIWSSIARRAGVRVGDGTAEDWASFESYIGAASDMPPVVVECSPERATLRVTQCPLAKSYQRTYPDYCPDVHVAMEEAIAAVINPRLRLQFDSFMSRGDDACVLSCELKGEK